MRLAAPPPTRDTAIRRSSATRRSAMLGARGQPAGRAVTVALVVADERDPATVPLLIAERHPQEGQDELGGLLDAVLPGAHRDDVRVVVLAGQLRCLPVPHEGRADAG